MKKFLLFTIAIIVAFSLVACQGGGGEQESKPHKESLSESVNQSILSSEVESQSESLSESIETSESLSESIETSESLPESEEESESGQDPSQVIFTVTFDTDGGNSIPSVEVKYGEKITPPENPVKSSKDAEYEFIGWFLGEEEWDFNQDVVICNITLVAKYKVVNSYTPPFLPKD